MEIYKIQFMMLMEDTKIGLMVVVGIKRTFHQHVILICHFQVFMMMEKKLVIKYKQIERLYI